MNINTHMYIYIHIYIYICVYIIIPITIRIIIAIITSIMMIILGGAVEVAEELGHLPRRCVVRKVVLFMNTNSDSNHNINRNISTYR